MRRLTALVVTLFALVSTALMLKYPLSAQVKRVVSLELVLAVDTSTSVDDEEFILQRNGLSAAFRDPGVIRSISNLDAGVAVALVQWAGPEKQRLAVDWQILSNTQSAERFARSIDRMKRAFIGFTDIGNAIAFSTGAIKTNAYEGERKTIDVSGDGTSDRNDPAPFRDLAVRDGIVINGLIIYSREYDLGDLARIELFDHYSKRVIGGAGAFLVEADSFADFPEAIRRKLVREISGANVVNRLPQRSLALSVPAVAR